MIEWYSKTKSFKGNPHGGRLEAETEPYVSLSKNQVRLWLNHAALGLFEKNGMKGVTVGFDKEEKILLLVGRKETTNHNYIITPVGRGKNRGAQINCKSAIRHFNLDRLCKDIGRRKFKLEVDTLANERLVLSTVIGR